MPQEITTTVYAIHELSEEARQRAIENHRYINVDDSYWHEDLIGTNGDPDKAPMGERAFFAQDGEKKGFDIRRIYFSGFYSQGDGASFEAVTTYEDYILKNRLGRKYRTLLNHVRGGESVTITTSGPYSHANTMHISSLYSEWTFSPLSDTDRAYEAAERADYQAETIRDYILEDARDLANDFYQRLEEEYEYLTSDEAVIEMLEANEFLFIEDGEDY